MGSPTREAQIEGPKLVNLVEQLRGELRVAYDDIIAGWARALDLRDQQAEGHTKRVAEWTVRLGRLIGMPDDELVHVYRGALLHDIGTMLVPDAVLLKPGSLTEEEWQIVRRHPVYAYALLSPIPHLRAALDIPYCHHEKWDGTGYPRGLKGDQIPLPARIFTVVDVWDALCSNRPYRDAWTREEAQEYICEHIGKDFDPQIVETFLGMDLEASE
jgi:HD-GYP domain-containing protein (c-di-GMP phosphodiesterase class II)